MPEILTGIARVKGAGAQKLVYTVDFDTGECDCPNGQAWRWDNRKWVPGNLCNHKLKAIASLIEITEDADDLRAYYNSSLGKRYNAFVAVSAMHKELRRGDAEAALYWAHVMIPHRGIIGVINYLRGIVFEETRDLALAKYLLRVSSRGTSVNTLDMTRAINRFAAAPKKWELLWRFDIFIDEQRAYQKLAKEFTYAVAKPKEIIPFENRAKLHKALIEGFRSADRVRMQYGLKGLFKMTSKVSGDDGHAKHRIWMFNELIDVLNGTWPNAFVHDEAYAADLHTVVMKRVQAHGAPGYHELNAFADALAGEPGADKRACLPQLAHKRIINAPTPYTLALGDFRRIPLYANDNHTWPGKALLRQYGATELQPGVPQTHIDFRYWGAYGGVAWRYLAFRQHATIDCKWEDVSWKTPSWLWGHVEQMNY